ncbi:MAG: SIMPL domain-containing protein, partial [Gemmatimonadetes bacterium]|nr:SIMPL domain-containing protein [Gemmatimonadota bacterium]
MQPRLLGPAFVLAAGLVVSALVLSNAWMTHLKTTRQTLDVAGSAKMTIESDFGILRGTISSAAPAAAEAFRGLEAQKPALTAYLTEGGFDAGDIRMFPPTTYATWEYDRNGHQTGRALTHTYAQRFEATSNDVRLVERVSGSIAELVERGVTLNLEMSEYHFTKLADIKMDVQALAAEDARM